MITHIVAAEQPVAESISYGSIWPEHHIFADAERGLSDDVSANLGRTFQIRRYTDEGKMLADLREGALNIASTSAIGRIVPAAALMYLPYLYRDFAHYRRVWQLGDNRVVLKIEDLIRKTANMEVLGYSLVGGRDCILVDKPIYGVADFEGLSIRVDEATVSTSIFDQLKASPKRIPFFEVAEALKHRRVLAAENAPFNMLTLGWHNHCKFVSCTCHRFLLNFELANTVFWNELGTRNRVSLGDAFAKYLDAFADRADAERTVSLNSLSRKHGLRVNVIEPTRRQPLEAACECVVSNFAATHELHSEIELIRRF
ncbi:MAG: TRAP-type transport system periplasmic protein [Bradyrhizobium sp.]|jgi:TRAP-type C4-dicarboxylate transport system substrate-binding protein|nr:TRAP-type transport system periplasmic protein [Bradyrhizobium sp.]